MTMLLELRCIGINGHAFHEADAGGLKEIAGDGQLALLDAWRLIIGRAKQAGWVKVNNGWICAACAAGSEETTEAAAHPVAQPRRIRA